MRLAKQVEKSSGEILMVGVRDLVLFKGQPLLLRLFQWKMLDVHLSQLIRIQDFLAFEGIRDFSSLHERPGAKSVSKKLLLKCSQREK